MEKILADTPERAEYVLRRARAERLPVGYDTETYDWSPGTTPAWRAKVVCFSLAGEDWKACIDGQFLHMFKDWLEDGSAAKITANDKFEEHVAANHHISLRGTVLDTVLASFTLDPHIRGGHGVEKAGKRHLGSSKNSFSDVVQDHDTVRAWVMDRDAFAAYSMDDAWHERKLGLVLMDKLKAHPWVRGMSYWEYYERYVQPFSHTLYGMEREGVLIDQEELHKSLLQAKRLKAEMECEVAKALGWAPSRIETFLNSPAQLIEQLYRVRRLPVLAFAKGGECPACKRKVTKATKMVCPAHPNVQPILSPSTSTPALLPHWKDPLVRSIVRYKTLDMKVKEIVGFEKQIHPMDGKIHTTLNQAVARTARLSSSAPNLQNVSSPEKAADKAKKLGIDSIRVRNAFITDAAAGQVLIDHDENQLEYRIMAHMSREPLLLEGFKNNDDFHSLTAIASYGLDCTAKEVKEKYPAERSKSKNGNFCLNYGGGKKKLAATLGITIDQAAEFIERRKRGLPMIYKWWEKQKLTARKEGGVYNILGWKRPTPDIYSDDDALVAAAERVAINLPIQSSGAEVLRCSMLQLTAPTKFWESEISERFKKTGAKLLLQIHDELLTTVHQDNAKEAGEIIKAAMEQPFPKSLLVPLVAEWGLGTSWEEAH